MDELEKYKEAVKEIALNGEDFFRCHEHDVSVLATAVYLILEQMVERKTEPSDSEKPNNCEWSVEYAKEMLDTMSCEECGHWEHGAGDHYYCALLEMGQECYFESKDESTLMFANEPKNEPTQNQRIESVETMSCQECERWIYDDRWGWFCPLKGQDECHYEPKTEPQTEDLQDWKDRMWAEAIVTEPQTERSE